MKHHTHYSFIQLFKSCPPEAYFFVLFVFFSDHRERVVHKNYVPVMNLKKDLSNDSHAQ